MVRENGVSFTHPPAARFHHPPSIMSPYFHLPPPSTFLPPPLPLPMQHRRRKHPHRELVLHTQ